jgi:hypothetical protein
MCRSHADDAREGVEMERSLVQVRRMKLRKGAEALPERPKEPQEGDLLLGQIATRGRLVHLGDPNRVPPYDRIETSATTARTPQTARTPARPTKIAASANRGIESAIPPSTMSF